MQVEALSGLLEAQTRALDLAVSEATKPVPFPTSEREQLKLAETALLLREELAQARADCMAAISKTASVAEPTHYASEAEAHTAQPEASLHQSIKSAFESEGVHLPHAVIQGMVAACRTRPSSPPACSEAEAERGVSPCSLKIRTRAVPAAGPTLIPALCQPSTSSSGIWMWT